MKTDRATRSGKGVLFRLRKRVDPKNSLYGRMFLEDMCADFGIDFSPTFNNNNDFFEIYPKSSLVEKLLNSSHSSFLRYEFYEQLSWDMHELIFKGKAYIEIIPMFSEQELVSLKFEPLLANRVYKKKSKTIFSARDYSGEIIKKSISNNRILILDLKDMGIKRNHFKKILNGLSKVGTPDFEWLNRKGITLKDYEDKQKVSAFKLVGKTYLSLKDYNNEHITRVYSMYRNVMHKLFRYRFLEYFLDRYNQVISDLGKQYGFSGEIRIVPEVNNHLTELEKLLNGDINCDQMSDVLFGRLK